jgi:NAD(P) transhydrogenase subunit alpha
MKIGVPKETCPGEARVALTPGGAEALKKLGLDVVVQSGAGEAAAYSDDAYKDKGAEVADTREAVFEQADVVLMVRTPGANTENGAEDLKLCRKGQLVVGTADPLGNPGAAKDFAGTGATLLALEMLPRITRAQSMDVLSSQATVAGYKAVLTAADNMPRMFPMLMTAAGTVTPAKVFVVGAGVAGLMAVAQARKLGAVVEAYDIRPAVKEQVESLGAKFVEMELEVGEAEDKGGYAKAMDEDFYRRQRELMAKVVAASDAVITTAAVPGRKAPVLVTTEMVESMRAGSVVVDLAAPGGGNCEAVKPGEVAEVGGVKVFGPLNLPAEVPADASRLFSGNLVNLLKHLVKEGELVLDDEDEITAGIIVTRDGKVAHPKVLEVLGAAGQASE